MEPVLELDPYLKSWAESFDGTPERPPYSVYQPIVSKYHQMGKTFFALRTAEVVSEMILGHRFDPDNISFDIIGFMERRMAIPRKTVQVLDEPQIIASSRTWHDSAQNDLSEMLMTTNRELKPALFPTPMTAMIDNRIFDVSTSQVTIDRKAWATVYQIDRDLLNRRGGKVRTRKLMTVNFAEPSASLRTEYAKRFAEYKDRRLKLALERVRSATKEAETVKPAFTAEELVPLILEDPQRFIGRDGKLSQSKIESIFNVPQNRANKAKFQASAELERRESSNHVDQSEKPGS